MGLFGIFATTIGLGAMAKTAISDSIATEKSYNRAIANGNLTYTSFGSKVRTCSTKTGKPCRMVWGTERTYLVDSKTGEVIEDVTTLRNNKNTEKARNEARANGCVFYRACDLDTDRKQSDAYKCEIMDGYFCKISGHTADDRVDVYIKGELKDWDGKKTVNINGSRKSDKYFSDGEPYSLTGRNKRQSEHQRNVAKKCHYKVYDYYDETLIFDHGYRGTEDNEWYARVEIGYRKYGYQRAVRVDGMIIPIESEPVYNIYGDIVKDGNPNIDPNKSIVDGIIKYKEKNGALIRQKAKQMEKQSNRQGN